ncbi:MAG: type II toxin-antitoxin system HicB family antitoxin [Cyclobacteriaceae bacterium]|nr:type II toxin-antitoxin system HicB family antitoxin [Cyclobacteriaceae bacterium]
MNELKSLLTLKIEKDGNEFHAWCPELAGCHTHGETVVKALDNLKDAVQLYIGCHVVKEILIKL